MTELQSAPPIEAPPIEEAPLPPPPLWVPFVAFILLFAAAMFFGAVLVGVVIFLRMAAGERDLLGRLGELGPELVADPRILLPSFFFNALMIPLLVFVFARRRGEPLRQTLRLTFRRTLIVDTVLATILVLAIGQLYDSFSRAVGWYEGSNIEAMSQAAAKSTGLMFAAIVVMGSIAGAFEEVFFRGFMQRWFLFYWPPRRAILVTAIAFGLLHVDPVHVLPATLMGLCLGWLAELEGTIIVGLIAHGLNNFVAFLLGGLLPDDFDATTHLILCALSLILGGLAFFALKTGMFRRPLG